MKLLICKGTGLLGMALTTGIMPVQTTLPASTPVPVIHVTDLYSPAQDPDDHWDLACQYALAYTGKIDLKGIVIDYVPDRTLAGKGHAGGDPDVRAVAQMNSITGLSVPVVIGTRGKITSVDLAKEMATRKDLGAVKFIHKVLRESDDPVVIHIVGTARDVALAGHSEPELFAEKCKAIYYNAGLSRNDGKSGEYNTGLDKIGYAAIFKLPCPVYWMPCFSAGSGWHKYPERRDELYGDQFNTIIEYETFWRFEHSEILPGLSENMQKFFAYMYRDFVDFRKQPRDIDYLRYLLKEVETDIIEAVSPTVRNMWCTAGFFHAASLVVDKNGHIQTLGEAESWYQFEPARIASDDNGATRWSVEENSENQFIFRYHGWDQYNQSMKQGMKELLSVLP